MDGQLPIRRATAADGRGIAEVKRQSFRVAYRGVLPDAFLDDLPLDPTPAYWSARAALPPSPRHALWVVGEATVHGFCDTGPARDADVDPSLTGEVYSLYLDPAVQRRGIGRQLLARAVAALADAGFRQASLWVVAGNAAACHFYQAVGLEPDGRTQRVPVAGTSVTELRFRRSLGETDP